MGDHGIDGQTFCNLNNVPNPYRPGKLDSVMHGHQTHRRVPTGLYRVMVWGPHLTPEGRPGGYQEAESEQFWGVTSRGDQRNLIYGRLLSIPGSVKRGVDIGGFVHSQWGRACSKVIEGCRIHPIQNKTSRPTLTLQ